MSESARARRLGRPPGSGALGPEMVRVSVCLPRALYDRLQAFAEGRAIRRGGPQMSACIREAVDHYFNCPQKRQPQRQAVTVTDPVTVTPQKTPRRRKAAAAH